MTVLDGVSNVAYKKSSWMRYALWGILLVVVISLGTVFGKMLHEQVSAAVPEGYRFSVSDKSWAEGGFKTTYYVYDDKILVEDVNLYADNEDGVDRAVTIYEDISTTDLEYDNDCAEEVSCTPKILTTIKNLVARKVGRPYVGL